ncbi:unnamed protein product [Acanthosepion pharaonis]|uniref:DUF7041 domain-containing protein n=1 Tax=Acanthosepion pharaonis TaxID=158019 RepID=A0A812CIT7_ACAPH|nr:unnamed protein product [Sepia pharaonis]
MTLITSTCERSNKSDDPNAREEIKSTRVFLSQKQQSGLKCLPSTQTFRRGSYVSGLKYCVQLDAIFQARHVTSQQSKFASVVEKLPAEVAAEVADILTSIPTDKPYETLKQAILHRTGFSEERKIRDLLTNITIGNSKPSQLLRRMQQLLGDNNISATVFRQMNHQKKKNYLYFGTKKKNDPVINCIVKFGTIVVKFN